MICGQSSVRNPKKLRAQSGVTAVTMIDHMVASETLVGLSDHPSSIVLCIILKPNGPLPVPSNSPTRDIHTIPVVGSLRNASWMFT
jgi:hypothetical protein